jgi:hypothetical protein
LISIYSSFRLLPLLAERRRASLSLADLGDLMELVWREGPLRSGAGRELIESSTVVFLLRFR